MPCPDCEKNQKEWAERYKTAMDDLETFSLSLGISERHRHLLSGFLHAKLTEVGLDPGFRDHERLVYALIRAKRVVDNGWWDKGEEQVKKEVAEILKPYLTRRKHEVHPSKPDSEGNGE